jgi:hypothetical protein
MTRQSRFAIGFLAAPLVLILLLYLGIGQLQGTNIEAGRWQYEVLQKKIAIAHFEHAKLIVLAGSSAHFGFSARQFEEMTGIPAVNLAVTAGFDRRYILYSARSVIGKGDLILLPWEYELYGNRPSQTALIFQVVAHDQAYLADLPLQQRLKFLADVDLISWLQLVEARLFPETAKQFSPENYDPAAINGWGDETTNTKPAAPEVARQLVEQPLPDFAVAPQAYNDLYAFIEYAKRKGARVVFTYPPIVQQHLPPGHYQRFFDDLRTLFASLGAQVIGTPQHATFPPEFLFDTVYHQDAAGRAHNTSRITRDLAAAGIIICRNPLNWASLPFPQNNVKCGIMPS